MALTEECVGTQSASSSQSAELEANEEQEQNIIARALANSCKDSRHPVASSRSQQSILMQQTSHLQAQQRASGPAAPRIRFTPFEESKGQASACIQSPYNTAPWVSMEGNDDSIPSQRFGHAQHHGSVILKGGPSYQPIISSTNHYASPGAISEASTFSREAIAANRAAGGIVGNLVRAMPVQIRNVALAPRRERHEVLLPVEQHQKDEEEWFRGETSRLVASSESHDNNLTEGILPMVQGPFNEYWSRTAQWLSVETQTVHTASGIHTLRAATSLAPPVRIRPMVAVCSAPPRRPEPEERHKNPNDEEATRQVLSQLRL